MSFVSLITNSHLRLYPSYTLVRPHKCVARQLPCYNIIMTNIKFAIIFIFALILAGTAPQKTKAFDATTSTSTLTGIKELTVPPVPQIITEIAQAKAMLQGVSLNYALSPVYKNVKTSAKGGSASGGKKTGKTTQVLTGYNLTAKDIALAIADQNGNITITKGMLVGTTMVFNDPAVNVNLLKFNGVNSSFQVNQPQGGTVVALKYLISNPDTGSKTKIEKGLSESLYTPYSSQLSSPEVIAYGAAYLDGIIKNVVADLQNIPSTAIPGETITQAIPPAMIKSLVYAEHTDTSKVLSGDVVDTANQLNILFATNQGDTYKYSVSNDGYSSRGIAQFVGSTYLSLVSRHPEAGLNPDFVAGMQDHENSIKAMYLLLDDYAGTVRVKASQGFVSGHVFEYGAAAYNGGTARVASAVNTYGDNWNTDHSGEINTVQDQLSSAKSAVAGLKKQIKTAKDKKTKADLNSQLVAKTSQMNDLSGQLAKMQSASLRNVTVNYLAKIYKVIQYFNGTTV